MNEEDIKEIGRTLFDTEYDKLTFMKRLCMDIGIEVEQIKDVYLKNSPIDWTKAKQYIIVVLTKECRLTLGDVYNLKPTYLEVNDDGEIELIFELEEYMLV